MGRARECACSVERSGRGHKTTCVEVASRYVAYRKILQYVSLSSICNPKTVRLI